MAYYFHFRYFRQPGQLFAQHSCRQQCFRFSRGYVRFRQAGERASGRRRSLVPKEGILRRPATAPQQLPAIEGVKLPNPQRSRGRSIWPVRHGRPAELKQRRRTAFPCRPEASGKPRCREGRVVKPVLQGFRHGLALPGLRQDVFWGGYSGYFSDPHGYLWEVNYSDAFQFGEDGSISF